MFFEILVPQPTIPICLLLLTTKPGVWPGSVFHTSLFGLNGPPTFLGSFL